MTISELQKLLDKFKAEAGDVEVHIEQDEYLEKQGMWSPSSLPVERAMLVEHVSEVPVMTSIGSEYTKEIREKIVCLSTSWGD